MKVALVYDRVNKWGGAERVLLALHEIWPEAPLYTSVYDKRLAPWADVFEVRTSFLQNFPLPKNRHELYPFLMGIAFESFSFDEFDMVISVTHEFSKAIITRPLTLHICYCLTPVGYLWSGYKQYFSERPEIFKTVSRPMVDYLRWYDKIVASRPDKYIAISQTVRERIKKYYGRESEVIYPPATMIEDIRYKKEERQNDYFLVVSRLVPNKRVDIAVAAFNQLGWPLKIIGSGSEERRLKRLARPNIEFLGHLTDQTMLRYYSSCRAVIVCGEEDFNLVAVEAQSVGKPVVAYGRGGVTESVVDGITGWFFEEESAESLAGLLKRVNLAKIDPVACIENAKKFSKERFKREFKEKVEEARREHGV